MLSSVDAQLANRRQAEVAALRNEALVTANCILLLQQKGPGPLQAEAVKHLRLERVSSDFLTCVSLPSLLRVVPSVLASPAAPSPLPWPDQGRLRSPHTLPRARTADAALAAPQDKPAQPL